MADEQRGFVKQIREIWSGLKWLQRLTIIGFGLLGLVLIGALIHFTHRIEYKTLYQDLNPADARAIAAKLKEKKESFIVQGTSILVAAPQAEINKLRLEINGAGLEGSGRIGFKVFDKSSFWMTDYDMRISYQRALEREIAAAISSLSEISQAHVLINLPKDSAFSENREEPKAVVILNLKKGGELSGSRVAEIKGVVAGAVPGLHRDNVLIIDEENSKSAR
jgi:flagellar M-ring protein FliF